MIGELVKELRLKSNLTQRQLGEDANLNRANPGRSIYFMESGRFEVENLMKVVFSLGITSSNFFMMQASREYCKNLPKIAVRVPVFTADKKISSKRTNAVKIYRAVASYYGIGEADLIPAHLVADIIGAHHQHEKERYLHYCNQEAEEAKSERLSKHHANN